MTRAIGILAASVGLSALVSQAPPAQTPAVEQYRGRQVAAGEVLVAFTQAPDVARVQADADVDTIAPVGHGEVWRAHSRRKNVAALLAAFAGRNDVAFVEPNYILYATTDPNDTRFPELWGLKNVGQVIAGVTGTPGADIGAASAWDVTRGSRNVVV